MVNRKKSNRALQDTSTGELGYKVMKGLNECKSAGGIVTA
jgi:hypothetical protein